jgi:hypothetical protein
MMYSNVLESAGCIEGEQTHPTAFIQPCRHLAAIPSIALDAKKYAMSLFAVNSEIQEAR